MHHTFDTNKSMITIQINANENIFYVSTSDLCKSDYFKSLLNFEKNAKDEERYVVRVDFEVDIFKYIIEHMKYGNISTSLSLDEKNKISQMADYLLYEPLMDVRMIQPPLSEFKVSIDTDTNTISSDQMDYVRQCLESKYSFNPITKTFSSECITSIYNFGSTLTYHKDMDTYMFESNGEMKRISKFTNDLNASIVNMTIYIKPINMVDIYLTLKCDGMLSVPSYRPFKTYMCLNPVVTIFDSRSLTSTNGTPIITSTNIHLGKNTINYNTCTVTSSFNMHLGRNISILSSYIPTSGKIRIYSI